MTTELPEPFDTGRLDVGDAHVLSYEHVGDRDGVPIVYLHGASSPNSPAPQNDEVLRRLLAVEPVWRPELGDDAVAGDFIGRAGWRRISEVWPPPDSKVIDDAIEAAARLVDYVIALEPVRRAGRA